jgi:ATP-dependent DNA helicase Q4
MTATATTTTLNAIMSALEIPSTNLIQNAKLRDNMQLSVSLSGNRQVQMTFFLFGYSIFF